MNKFPLAPIKFSLSQKEMKELNAYVSRDEHPNPYSKHIIVAGSSDRAFFKVCSTDHIRLFFIEKELNVEAKEHSESFDFLVTLPISIVAGRIELHPDYIINNGQKLTYPVYDKQRIPNVNIVIPRFSDMWFTDVSEGYMRMLCDCLLPNANSITKQFTFDVENQIVYAENEDEFFSSYAKVEFREELYATKNHLNYPKIAINGGFLREIFKYKKSDRMFRIFWPQTNNRIIGIYDFENKFNYLLMPIAC